MATTTLDLPTHLQDKVKHTRLTTNPGDNCGLCPEDDTSEATAYVAYTCQFQGPRGPVVWHMSTPVCDAHLVEELTHQDTAGATALEVRS